jgi:hypothetical protein
LKCAVIDCVESKHTPAHPRRLSLVESMESRMTQPQRSWRAVALAAPLAIFLAATGAHARQQAQTNDDSAVGKAVAAKQAREIRNGEPARWHRDDPSRQARLRTLQKEIGAAYQEAKNACREGVAAERNACLKEARATYEQDMKNAPSQLDAAPEGSVQTSVQTSTAAPPQSR